MNTMSMNSLKLKSNYLKRVVIVIMILLSLSCSEEFLEVKSNQETAGSISSDQAVELVNATYNSFLTWEVNSFSWIGVSSIASDDADKGSDPGDTGVDKHQLDALTFDATSLSVSEVWEGHYNGIQRANQAINRIQIFDDLDSELKNRLLGEAKFLRALLYFRLVKTFGGVPLIADALPDFNDLSIDTEELLARASKDETYAFLELELKEAVDFLPEKSEYPTSELGRATKGAAKSLLAKVMMYQSKWEQVYALTNEVILSREYSLTPNYEDIWKEAGENNQESIFEIQARGETPAAGIHQYSVVQGARGEGGWGWGFNTPSEDLVDSYEDEDTRKDATIIFRGETLFDGREVPETVVNSWYNQKAYSSSFTDAVETGKNIRILRYAEVLLMNAEAALELGEDAATPLNMVRNRAGLEDETEITQLTIWNERRHELAFEHDRYFDLVRQGRAKEVLTALGKPFEEGKHELFPIPNSQIDLSDGVLKQNPGW